MRRQRSHLLVHAADELSDEQILLLQAFLQNIHILVGLQQYNIRTAMLQKLMQHCEQPLLGYMSTAMSSDVSLVLSI